MSSGVVRFACSSCSRLRESFVVFLVREGCGRSYLLPQLVLRVIRVRFSRVLRVFCLRQFDSRSFKVFLCGWVYDPSLHGVRVDDRWLVLGSTSQESQCLLDRAAVLEVVLSHASVVADVFACVCEALLCCRDSCSLFYLLFELTYCCSGVNRVRIRRRNEDVAVVVCLVVLKAVDVPGG